MTSIDRRALLKLAGLASLAAAVPREGWTVVTCQTPRLTTPFASARASSSSRRTTSSRPPCTTISFPVRCCASQKAKRVVVDVHNDTDTPELVHWHGQMVPSDVDGASEEGTPFVPAHGMRRIVFVPRPGGIPLLSHACLRRRGSQPRHLYGPGRARLHRAESRTPGAYDREVFLILKEFGASWSRGGDMAMDMLAGAPSARLQEIGKAADERRKGTREGLRGRLRAVQHQRSHARSRRADPREVRRARAVPRPQCAARPRFAALRCPATCSTSWRSTVTPCRRRRRARAVAGHGASGSPRSWR